MQFMAQICACFRCCGEIPPFSPFGVDELSTMISFQGDWDDDLVSFKYILAWRLLVDRRQHAPVAKSLTQLLIPCFITSPKPHWWVASAAAVCYILFTKTCSSPLRAMEFRSLNCGVRCMRSLLAAPVFGSPGIGAIERYRSPGQTSSVLHMPRTE